MDFTALVLTIIGALNWALVGIFQFDLVAWIFGGQGALVSRIIYTIIGLAGIWDLVHFATLEGSSPGGGRVKTAARITQQEVLRRAAI